MDVTFNLNSLFLSIVIFGNNVSYSLMNNGYYNLKTAEKLFEINV